MADWTTLPDAAIEEGKPVRAVDGRALRDNPIAIAEGATGAPRIQTAALENEVIIQGKIKFVSNSSSGNIGPGQTVVINLGAYAFFPNLRVTSGDTGSMAILGADGAAGTNGRLRIRNTSGGSNLGYTIQWTNIAAS